MEYYKFWLDGKLKYLVILGHHNFHIYDEDMGLEEKYTEVWVNAYREELLSKATLVTDENELAKLMLVCHT